MQNGEDGDGEDNGDVVAAGDEACVENGLDELQEVFELIWGDQVKRITPFFIAVHDISDCQYRRRRRGRRYGGYGVAQSVTRPCGLLRVVHEPRRNTSSMVL